MLAAGPGGGFASATEDVWTVGAAESAEPLEVQALIGTTMRIEIAKDSLFTPVRRLINGTGSTLHILALRRAA
jgi:hypothetical protein